MNQLPLYDRIDALLASVQKPAAYAGGELNQIKKDPKEVSVRFAFCFPDTYEIGMSNLGMKILYHVINQCEEFACERVFAPWVDMEKTMRDNDIPLFAWESRTPVKEFDLVGFTLQYEMSYTNVLNMLSLSGIPLLRDARDVGPFIVAGGTCALNPEPLADFIDLFLLGDGEEVLPALCEIYAAWKTSGQDRDAFLLQASKLDGVYAPKFYDVSYLSEGPIAALTPTHGVPQTVRKAVVKDLDKAAFPDKILVPYCEIVFDRIMLEIFRGCTRGCRFCQAGMVYRPVRNRSLDTLFAQAEALVKSTGYEEISLSSLSTGDYPCLPELAKGLMERFEDKKVALSLPSLRIDSILGDTLAQTGRVKKTGLTFAPEAGTQRLRDVINKGVTEEDLLDSVRDAFSKGFSGVKLYFMIGLPTETPEDLIGIAQLGGAVIATYKQLPKEMRAKGLRVTASLACFVPKPHTPFQWAAQDSIAQLQDKIRALQSATRAQKGLELSWHEPYLSYLEGVFARGDRRLGKVLLRAHELGCRMDGWKEHFHFNVWMQAFADCGIDPDFYTTRARSQEEILPWAHIDSGVTPEFLFLEWQRAMQGILTPDCRDGCQNCGLLRCEGVCV